MKYPFTGDEPCAQVGTDVFFPEVLNVPAWQRKLITTVCYSCPIQSTCLEWGMRHEEFGFWGGLSPNQRKELRRKAGVRFVGMATTVYRGRAA